MTSRNRLETKELTHGGLTPRFQARDSERHRRPEGGIVDSGVEDVAPWAKQV